MKKKLIAVAIATAFAAPAFADNSNIEFYGKVNLDVESVSNNKAVAPNDSAILMTNNASRLGLKGKEDLGDGLSAVYQYEFEVNPTNSTAGTATESKAPFTNTRNSRIGLEGAFGTIFMGTWDTPYKVAHNKVELFDNAGSFSAGKLIGITGNAKSYVTRQNADIQYWTPKMDGFQGLISYALGNKTAAAGATPATNKTRLSASGVYENDMFYGALAYENRPDQTTAGRTDTATRLVGAGKFGDAQVGLTYERLSTGTAATVQSAQNNWELSGKMKFGASTIGAFYAKNGNIGNTANSGAKMFSLRYGYNFSKRTELWAAYSSIKNDANATYSFYQGSANAGSTDSGFCLGLSHTF